VRDYVDIHAILSDTLALSAAQLGKDGILLQLNVARDLPRIFAHYQQIQQVFLNLINNARYALNQKFVDGNDSKVLTISAEAVSKNAADYVQITFLDMGTGIPADIVNKIFNPFFSTKPRGAGTGLGLSISHGITTDHGGEIIIDSSVGKYTKIDVLLPTGSQHG
jgi:signal transduction histidine kinase